MRILAIDVGPEHSAWCELNGGAIGRHAWVGNEILREVIGKSNATTIVLESPQAQDRPLGKLLRDTIWWAGRFAERAEACGYELVEAEERDVAFWLTGNRSASNPAILQSLKDVFGETRERMCNACNGTGVQPGIRKATTKKCVGCRGKSLVKEPGPLAGLNEHERSALAAAWWHHKRSAEQRKQTA